MTRQDELPALQRLVRDGSREAAQAVEALSRAEYVVGLLQPRRVRLADRVQRLEARLEAETLAEGEHDDDPGR